MLSNLTFPTRVVQLFKKLRAGLLLTAFTDGLRENDILSMQRFRLFRTTTLFSLIVFIVTTCQISATASHNYWMMGTVSFLFAAMFANYFLLAIHKNGKAAYTALLVLSFSVLHIISYKQGGVRNSGLFYLATLILAAFMFLGKRGGKSMAAAAIVHLIYFYFVNTYTDWVDYSMIGTETGLIDFDFLSTGTLCLLLLAGQADHIEKTNKAVTGDIEAKRDELAAKNEQLLHIQRDLKAKNDELLRKNKELEQFAYVASHDLQEPLRTVTDFVHLFQKKYHGHIDQKADQYLSFIEQGSTRMQVLINDLLEFSLIGTKRVSKQVDCNAVINDVLKNTASEINESGAVIETDNLPTITGYATELKSLFQNLLMNSIKFRQEEVKPKIKISVSAGDKEWRFSIEDNGIGIAPEYYDRIFIIFQRLHTRKEYPGSGIGLAHCKKIVELHRGEIWLESEEGRGTTFYFTIPK